MTENKKVRVAIIGVGNCASSFVQGVEFYKNSAENDRVPGLMHVNLGGYHIRDIEFSAAFDVVDTKVGKDLSEAIYAYPNNTYKFADVPFMNIPVSRGMTHDGLGKYLSQILKKAPGPTTIHCWEPRSTSRCSPSVRASRKVDARASSCNGTRRRPEC